MTGEECLAIFKKLGAHRMNGHYVLASGKHSREYFAKGVLFDHERELESIAAALAVQLVTDGVKLVIAPMKHGFILATAVAGIMKERYDSPSVMVVPAEKGPDESFSIADKYIPLIRNREGAFIEDVITSGGTLKKCISVAWSHGVRVSGIYAVVNREGKTAAYFSVPKLVILADAPTESWEYAECPMCHVENVPVDEINQYGKDFAKRQRGEVA